MLVRLICAGNGVASIIPSWRSCSVSLGGERPELLGFVQDHPGEWIELAEPGLAREHRLGVSVPRVPTLLDAGGAEIDVLGVVLAIELRSKQLHHVHPGLAAIAYQLAHLWPVALGLGQSRCELIDDMA